MKIIDISLSLGTNIPIWPGSTGFNLTWSKQLAAGDSCNNSIIECDSHIGTHLDAPSHFINYGTTIDQLSLDTLIGPCTVVYFPDVGEITSFELSEAKIASNTTRLLVRTNNSEYWSARIPEFKENFTAFTPDAARWIVDQDIHLIGIDYLSVGSYKNGILIHKILLEAGILVLEGLNLKNVVPDEYELICLPLNVKGAEGAPARAVLRK
jgi:arylformamidase